MNDSGTIAVKEQNKKVVLEIPPNTARVVLDPRMAIAVADAIAQSAYIADYGIHPDNALKNAVVEEKALKLKKRVALMLNSLKSKPNDYAAEQIVDIVLSEIL